MEPGKPTSELAARAARMALDKRGIGADEVDLIVVGTVTPDMLFPATGCVVDNGQHLFMGCYHATLRFLAEIGTLDRVRFQPRLAVWFLEREGRSSSLVCPDLPAPLHLFAGVLRSGSLTLRQKLEVLRLGRALGSGNGSAPPERLTVDEWLSRLGQSETLRRNFWDLLSIAALNEDPRIASASLFDRVLRLALLTSPEDSRLGLAVTGLIDDSRRTLDGARSTLPAAIHRRDYMRNTVYGATQQCGRDRNGRKGCPEQTGNNSVAAAGNRGAMESNPTGCRQLNGDEYLARRYRCQRNNRKKNVGGEQILSILQP